MGIGMNGLLLKCSELPALTRYLEKKLLHGGIDWLVAAFYAARGGSRVYRYNLWSHNNAQQSTMGWDKVRMMMFVRMLLLVLVLVLTLARSPSPSPAPTARDHAAFPLAGRVPRRSVRLGPLPLRLLRPDALREPDALALRGKLQLMHGQLVTATCHMPLHSEL